MARKRILLVDDEPDFVETVEFFLSGSDYQVFVAKNGKEAVQQVKMKKPDLSDMFTLSWGLIILGILLIMRPWQGKAAQLFYLLIIYKGN